MKPSLDKSKVSFSFSEVPAVPSYSFYEYHWDGPRRLHVPVWQPRQTTLLVVFDGVSRCLFSTARLLLYYNHGSPKDAQAGNVWDVQQLGSAIHSFKGQVRKPSPNPSSLPKLTVAFEVAVGRVSSNSSVGILVLRPPKSIPELRRNSISVLLECELALTSDTSSLSLSFTHSTMLCTPTTSGSVEMLTHPASHIELVTTRIVRVLPPVSARPKITNGCLPTELLIKTFKDAEFRHTWQDDLLSFAQVCRAWVCAMDVLHAHLYFSGNDRWSRSRPLVDVYALAKALREKPLLAHGFHHLTTDNFGGKLEGDGQSDDDDDAFHRHVSPRMKNPARFTAALITILGTTKNVRYVHLGQLDPSQADALFAVLHNLSGLRTLSLGPVVEERPLPTGALIQPGSYRATDSGSTTRTRPPRLLSVVQLARCMARWPALSSLTVHHLHPGLVPTLWRFALRPPSCTLTQLTLSRSHVADRDLAHLFAASAAARSLERVVLDRVAGVTSAGLTAFLRAVAPSVVCLAVRDVALPPAHQRGSLVVGPGGRAERALDAVVDKMPRLRELRISGDVASEFMLDRRSRMFVAHNERAEGPRVPVVRLWMEDVPRLCGFAADAKWPGWCTPGKGSRR